MDEKEKQLLVELLAKAVGVDNTHVKADGGVHTAQRLHGIGGLFAVPGLEREIVTAHIRPQGISSVLPFLPSVYEDPRFGSITGVSDDIGAEAAHACADAPTGYIKGCNLTARFGMVRKDTEKIEMDKVMLKLHRHDPTDLVLRGRLLGLTNLAPSGMNEQQILNVITMSEMVNTAVRAERELNRQIWQGTVAIANQFPGLDVQIATGQVDADTNVACPALDSDVKDYDLELLGADIVYYLSQLEWYLRYNADAMGLAPVEWVLAMRPDLWYELTAIWPCAYNTNRCANNVVGAQSQTVIMGSEMVAERDAMRNGKYIDINGNRYRVIVDTGIYEHNANNNPNLIPGEYASTIYMVPLTITGGMPVTYRQYVDYSLASPDVSLLRGMEDFFWTDGGTYSWAIEQIKWCYKLALKTEQRIILRTPHLAGRIDNIKYSPLQHLRDPDPDSPYWKDGGVSLRPDPTFYAVWDARQ
jgi:hypothetical protein